MDYPSKFRAWILEAIQEYPLITHGQLLDFLVERKKRMAKRTLEKYLRELINEKKIFKYKERKTTKYDLPSSFGLTEKMMKKRFDKWMSEIKKSIGKIESDYRKYNIYMKVNTPDYLQSLYKSLQSIHQAHERQEEYNWEDLGTRENILYNEIVKATEGNMSISMMQIRNNAAKLRDEIRRLKKEDHCIYKKLKRGIKNPVEREKLLAEGNKIGKEIGTAFNELEKIHEELATNKD